MSVPQSWCTEMLRDLMEGNKRFMTGQTTSPRRQRQTSRRWPRDNPRLFVVRVAGNIVGGANEIVKGSM